MPMEFSAPREQMVDALRLAAAVASRTPTNPLLTHALLRASKSGKVDVAATDLVVSVARTVEAKDAKHGAVAVEAKTAFDMVKKLDGDVVLVKQDDRDWITLTCGGTEYRLAAIAGRDFPTLPEPNGALKTVPTAGVLADVLSRVEGAASRDETRPHICCVQLDAAVGKLGAVATDGHRLARIERPWEGADFQVLLPLKFAVEAQAVLRGAAEFGVSNGHAFARAGATTMAGKLVDAQFPPWAAVVPAGRENPMVVERARFLAALERVEMASADRGHGVRVELARQRVTLLAEQVDRMFGREQVAAEYDAVDRSLGFNGRYLIEMIKTMDAEKVEVFATGELDPTLIRPAGRDDHLVVVMPMRL